MSTGRAGCLPAARMMKNIVPPTDDGGGGGGGGGTWPCVDWRQHAALVPAYD